MRPSVYIQRLCSIDSCVSSGNTMSSMYTSRCRSSCTSPVVCANSTFRSSSPWTNSTGEFQPSIAPIADDLNDSASGSNELPRRWTPARSTPALKTSELRASACAVSRPPYDRPQMPTRSGSTSGRVCRYFAPARTSWYSELPAAPAFAAARNDRP